MRHLSKSFYLLLFSLAICSLFYPALLWMIAQSVFPFQANGSRLFGPDHQLTGSKLIAQDFTQDEYFHPRPSAVFYNAAASGSSSLAPSNFALRYRVACALGLEIRDQTGKSLSYAIESFFQEDPYLVAKWAKRYPLAAQAWIKDNPTLTPSPLTKPSEILLFFTQFSKEHPGQFPAPFHPISSGKTIQSLFFEMWLEKHQEIPLQQIPSDGVMTSASGLDPHITLRNAFFQKERVAAKWASLLNKEHSLISQEITQLLEKRAQAPWNGLIGEKYINVLEINLELDKLFKGQT